MAKLLASETAEAVCSGAMQTLAGPVVNSVSQSTARVLGTGSSSNGKPDGAAATVRWQSGRRVHLDLDPLLPFPRWHEHAAIVEEPVRKIPGVATAHVEGSLGRLVIELDDDVDSDAVLDQVRDVVASAAAEFVRLVIQDVGLEFAHQRPLFRGIGFAQHLVIDIDRLLSQGLLGLQAQPVTPCLQAPAQYPFQCFLGPGLRLAPIARGGSA